MTIHNKGPMLGTTERVDLFPWLDQIHPETAVPDTIEAARERAWATVARIDPAWYQRNQHIVAKHKAGLPITETDLAAIDLRPLDAAPSPVAEQLCAVAEGVVEQERRRRWTEEDVELVRKAVLDTTGLELGAKQVASIIRGSAGYVTTAFECRLGLETYADPAGRLLQAIIHDLWVDADPADPKARPRIRSFRFDRHTVMLETRFPLTPEQFAAISAACRAFDAAVLEQRAATPGATVAP